MQKGYYREPTIYENKIAFVSDDDIWLADIEGSAIASDGKVVKNNILAHRLTGDVGVSRKPCFSPDGKLIAFSSTAEGYMEVYITSVNGDLLRRITYLGASSSVIGWLNNEEILFSSDWKQPHPRTCNIFKTDLSGNVNALDLMHGRSVCFKGDNENTPAILQRHGSREYAYWKRYRGGMAGVILYDNSGDGNYLTLPCLKGIKADFATPVFMDDKIYFVSDHEGIGRVYGCDLDGEKLFNIQPNKLHENFYVKNLNTDGKSIVYQAGGAIYYYSQAAEKVRLLDVYLQANLKSKSIKFADMEMYFHDYDLHKNGDHVLVNVRGRAMIANRQGGATRNIHNDFNKRTRISAWINQNTEILIIYNKLGEEFLSIYDGKSLELLQEISLDNFSPIEIGRIVDIKPFNLTNKIIVKNHANKLLLLDLNDKNDIKVEIIEDQAKSILGSFDVSCDDNWVSYSCPNSTYTSTLTLYNCKNKSKQQILDPVLRDEDPCFSKDGKYLYFLSMREFDPSWDGLCFDMKFSKSNRPHVIVLSKEGEVPFIKNHQSLPTNNGDVDEKEHSDAACNNEDNKKTNNESNDKANAESFAVCNIDLEGIANRAYALPLPVGIYEQMAVYGDKLFWLEYTQNLSEDDKCEESYNKSLKYYSFSEEKTTVISKNCTSFKLVDKFCIFSDESNNLRTIDIGEKFEDNEALPPLKRGFVDKSRFFVKIDPKLEWQQMYFEAWRLQNDHSWAPLSGKNIDSYTIKDKYSSLLEIINTRGELEELIWEMQGEFGLSHAYAYGGDLPINKNFHIGKLGIEVSNSDRGFVVEKIITGDSWDSKCTSPLNRCDINVKVGDVITEIDGQRVTNSHSIGQMLLNKAGKQVEIAILKKDFVLKKGQVADGKIDIKNNKDSKDVVNGIQRFHINTLVDEQKAIYRDWVEYNKKYINDKTDGKIGYIHIPDMSYDGYGEFHRNFLKESEKDGLIVDVRYNGGGCVSSLLLEKLARKHIGFGVSRHFGIDGYPHNSSSGVMVAITNEYSGSDGDIFSHCFKRMQLGPLIGKRTWGGVVGIMDRYYLADNGRVTQPEFHTWFMDIGFGLENHGADPDIEIDNSMQDIAKGIDAQLDKGIAEVMTLLKKSNNDKNSNISLKKRLKQDINQLNNGKI